ncbi:hypothetical protein THAOC_11970, partial [Thalassiosira oceanica]
RRRGDGTAAAAARTTSAAPPALVGRSAAPPHGAAGHLRPQRHHVPPRLGHRGTRVRRRGGPGVGLRRRRGRDVDDVRPPSGDILLRSHRHPPVLQREEDGGDGDEEGGGERRHGHKLRRPGDVREEVRQVRLEPDRGGVENSLLFRLTIVLGTSYIWEWQASAVYAFI